eukprot:12893827-Prorocentrum_lima.AAC.1
MVLEEGQELGEREPETPNGEERPGEDAYAATAPKLRKAEARVSHLSADEARQLASAKDEEIATWIKRSV